MSSQLFESSDSKYPALPIHYSSVPYASSSSRLQTLDVWLPRPLEESDPQETIWIVYIHGGAWRDPLQDSSCILPTLSHLSSPTSSSTLNRIAGIASINYRLSPYPNHPTHASTPEDSDRNVQHPTHIQDVDTALQFLSQKFGIGSEDGRKGYEWIGVGHSCGATLLLQHLCRIGLQPQSKDVKAPAALILMSGIYSLPTFLSAHVPPHCPSNIAQIYQDIVTGAFGPSQSDWEAASPVSGSYSLESRAAASLLVLAHSAEDEMVEEGQRDVMLEKLSESGWVGRDGDSGELLFEGTGERKGKAIVEMRALKGAHDWVWEDGEQVAGLIGDVVGGVLGERRAS